jgi:hypothetical protein
MKRIAWYKGIGDLPVWNFRQVQDTGDLNYLLKLEDYSIAPRPKLIRVDLRALWDTIIEEYIERFDLPQLEKRILNKQLQVNHLVLDYLISQDKALVTMIKLRQRELRHLVGQRNGEAQDLDTQAALLESHFGVAINLYQMSVKRFYTYMELYARQVQLLNEKPRVRAKV